MRIIRTVTAVLVLLVLAVSSCALAEGTYYGSVVCGKTLTVPAPFGGVLADVSVRRGDLIREGDLICTIGTTYVYSPVEGTVSAVFGAGGDDVEEVKNRRGGVVYIIPAARFSVKASDAEASHNPDCHISVGQTVWLQAGRKTAPVTGTGTVTAVSTDPESTGSYTVEIESGVYSPEESIFIYRKESPEPSALIGMGTVAQTPPVVVSGEGSILRVHVKPGSEVKRGSLLFETVSGTLKAMKSGDNRVAATTDGIVASVEAGDGMTVEQNSVLITMYPLESMQACISVPETSLSLFPEGQPVHLTFGTDDEREGVVKSVDYLADADENAQASVGYANYRVYIDFEQKDGVRQGMFVTVDLP